MNTYEYEVGRQDPSGLHWLKKIDHSFGKVRKDALNYWQQESNRSRKIGSADDDFSDSQFCILQNRVNEKFGDNAHLALFCNLGDWCSHVTDILLETSNDDVNLADAQHARKMLRYYARLMLVLSELVDDVAKVIEFVKSEKCNKGRESIESGPELCGFVNNFVKHKKDKSHCYDHHWPVIFQDAIGSEKRNTDITFGQLDPEKGDRFYIPSLETIVQIALECEKKLSESLCTEQALENVFNHYKGKR
jgi:hypothetical protein